MSRPGERPEIRRLHAPGLDRASFDLQTGLLLLSRGGNSLVGTPDDIRTLCRAALRACAEADRPRHATGADALAELEAQDI